MTISKERNKRKPRKTKTKTTSKHIKANTFFWHPGHAVV
jgi:hypothetical protein